MQPSNRGPEQGVVLIDTTSLPDEVFDVSFLERNGHRVVVCHGPEPHTVCPLLDARGCEMFDKAHGVIFQLDLDYPQHRAILERYRELDDDVPIRVVVRPEQADRYRELLARFEVLEHDPTAADLDGFSAEVEAADRLPE